MNKVSLADEQRSPGDVELHHRELCEAVRETFARRRADAETQDESNRLADALSETLLEIDRTDALFVVASLEATIRVDYLTCVDRRWRDPLSRAFRTVHRERSNRARLSEDLIARWTDIAHIRGKIVAELRQAIKYRNWLAHGRYWTLKLGEPLDFETVFDIVEEFGLAMRIYNTLHGRGPLKTRSSAVSSTAIVRSRSSSL